MDGIPILHFVTSFHLGGTERQVANLVHGLRRSGYRVHVACFRAQGELRDEIADGGVPLIELPTRSLASFAAARQMGRLALYLRRHRIEIMHASGTYPNLLGVPAARLAGTPVVIASVRDMGDEGRPGLMRAQRLVCRLADVVLANAEAVRERLRREGYAPERLAVVPNGIDAGVAGGPPRLKRELGIPEGAPVVGVVSRLDRVKGLDVFLEAARHLGERHPGVWFVIVGGAIPGHDDGYLRELQARAAALGLGPRFVVTGRRRDVPAILPELAVSVLPSLSEGLSNSILESMAAGLPVVATDVGGSPELVAHGETGLLVPPAQPVALAEAIERLLRDPSLAAAMGRRGRQRVQREFTCARMTSGMVDLYRMLLSRAHARRWRWQPMVGREVGP